MSHKNLNQWLLAVMETYGDRPSFRIKRGERYRSISYSRFETMVFRVVKFFQEQGITEGERVAIVIRTRLEWMVVYIASLLAGGVAVPLRASLAVDTLSFILRDCGARLVVLENEEFIQRISALAISEDQNRLADLKTLLVLDQSQTPGAISLRAVLADTNALTIPEIDTLRAKAKTIKPEALATIHYTGSETDRPRGAVFDQARLMKIVEHIGRWFELEDDDVAFTVLSWSIPASLQVGLHYFVSGVPNVLNEGSQLMIDNMRQTSPTITLNMPYFFERFYDHIMRLVGQMPEASQEVFHWAVAKGKEFRAAGADASESLREEHNRADLTFFAQIRGWIGGRMRCFYSTGAPLPQNLAEIFEAMGLPVLDTYSLTEAGGFPAVNRMETRRLDSCGQASPGFEIRINEEEEVLIRGETVMLEYWRQPARTEQTIEAEGWLHTDDLGYLDETGSLHLTGRKRSLMVLSTGRKIVPATIEEMLGDSPLIAQAVVFGEGRPYVSALLVPDLAALASRFDEKNESSDQDEELKWFWPRDATDSQTKISVAHPQVKMMLDKVVEKANRRLDRWERIETYSLLDQAGGEAATELDELMPADRHLVAQRYATQIEAMYPDAPPANKEAVTEVEVSPERMRALLEKESILDAWMTDAGIEFLFELARAKQIDAPSMVHICDAAATIAQTESEEKPLSTAIIVGDPTRIGRVLPVSQIQLLRHDHIRRMQNVLVTLAKLVDGRVLGYVLDKHGYVRGVHKLNVSLAEQSANFLFGPLFRHHAAISDQCDTVVFLVPPGGRQVRIFADGELMGRYSNGDWSPETVPYVSEILSQAQKQNYDPDLIQRILRCAFQMAEKNLGAIFVIGQAQAVMERSDISEINHFARIIRSPISQMSDREIINFAKQDGATMIDLSGQFWACMVLLRPTASTEAEVGPGRGARHSSAAKMSAEAHCLAITVSQDGPITIYNNGRRVLSL